MLDDYSDITIARRGIRLIGDAGQSNLSTLNFMVFIALLTLVVVGAASIF